MLYHFLCIFFVYAFLGWCTEVCYAALETGEFVNRGFLNGPMCPIYGFGVVIVLGCLTPLSDNLPVLFIGSVLLTSILSGSLALCWRSYFINGGGTTPMSLSILAATSACASPSLGDWPACLWSSCFILPFSP